MIALLLAVVSASLLGSLHCAGMCGPFALFAATEDGRVRSSRLAAYHVGRLVTYLLIGVVVGVSGQAFNATGEAVGLPVVASQVAGVLLIGLAVWKVWPQLWLGSGEPGRVARFVASLRPAIQRLPAAVRPAAIGSVTVLLPCGWLYAFAIVAAGSGGVLPAVLVMSAFWVGTVPWLSGLTVLAKPLNARPQVGRVVTATLLAAAGLYTMTGRAAADFRPLIDSARAATSGETLEVVTELPPACCRVDADESGSDLLDEQAEGRR